MTESGWKTLLILHPPVWLMASLTQTFQEDRSSLGWAGLQLFDESFKRNKPEQGLLVLSVCLNLSFGK